MKIMIKYYQQDQNIREKEIEKNFEYTHKYLWSQ